MYKKLSTSIGVALLVLVGSFLPMVASAYTITTTNLTAAHNGFGYSTATAHKSAQCFTSIGAGDVTSVLVSMSYAGTPTDNFVISLEETTAGAPNGTVLSSVSVPASSISSTPTDYTYTFATSSLAASTVYCFVFSRTGSDSTSNYYNDDGDSVGSLFWWMNSGVWTSTAGTHRLVFDVNPASGGGGATAGWPVSPFGTATTTYTVVDNPTQDYFNGLALFLFGFVLILWLFKGRK